MLDDHSVYIANAGLLSPQHDIFRNTPLLPSGEENRPAEREMASTNNALGVFFILTVVCAVCAAKKGGEKKDEGVVAAPAPGGAVKATGAEGTFDISKLGASGDGKTDSTKV
jgi:hypothetical protein